VPNDHEQQHGAVQHAARQQQLEAAHETLRLIGARASVHVQPQFSHERLRHAEPSQRITATLAHTGIDTPTGARSETGTGIRGGTPIGAGTAINDAPPPGTPTSIRTGMRTSIIKANRTTAHWGSTNCTKRTRDKIAAVRRRLMYSGVTPFAIEEGKASIWARHCHRAHVGTRAPTSLLSSVWMPRVLSEKKAQQGSGDEAKSVAGRPTRAARKCHHPRAQSVPAQLRGANSGFARMI